MSTYFIIAINFINKIGLFQFIFIIVAFIIFLPFFAYTIILLLDVIFDFIIFKSSMLKRENKKIWGRGKKK